MLLETYDVLADHGLSHKVTFAQEIADSLEASPVSDLKDISDSARAPWVDDLRKAHVGDAYSDEVRDELNDMVSELTRPKGLVHYALRNGCVLCSTTVQRKLTDSDNGTTYLVKRTARFVTDVPEIAMQYRIGPALVRLERQAASVSEMAADGQLRIPALSGHLPRAIQRAHRTIRAELPETAE